MLRSLKRWQVIHFQVLTECIHTVRHSGELPMRNTHYLRTHSRHMAVNSTLAKDEVRACRLQQKFEIRWSKTIQFRQKVLRMQVLPTKNKAICPVFWTHVMIQLVPAGPMDPVLAIRDKQRLVSLSANQLIYRLRKWLLLIGEDPSIFSLHRGGATFAYQSDIEGEMIKSLGG